MTETTVRGSSRQIGGYPVVLPGLRDPRVFLAMVTVTLHTLGQVAFHFNVSIAQILITLGTCAVIEFPITLRRDRTIAWPSSAVLTGNGIALIMRVPGTEAGDWWSLHGWYIFVGTSILAMASKYMIRIKGRHIFNPSNFAVVAVFIALGENRADPQVLWWGPWSVPIAIAFAVILGGSMLVTRRVNQGHTAVSYWVTFALCAGVIALTGHSITANWHVGPVGGMEYWLLLITSPEVLVFTFYMITDPKTAPGGRVGQSIYGAGIAIVGSFIIATQAGEFGTKVGILSGLVVMCGFVRLIESKSPFKRSVDDRPLRRLRELVLGAPGIGSVRPRAIRRVGGTAVACSCVACLAGLLAVSAVVSPSAGEPSDAAIASLDRRAEVPVPSDLPTIGVDKSSEVAGIEMTDKLAKAIGTDVAHDLLIEAKAIADRDPDLAASAASGKRLEQVTAAAKSSKPKSNVKARTFQFDSLLLTLFKTSPSPQAPPELAIHATGTTQLGDGTKQAFDSTFTIAKIRGTYLIAGEYDKSAKLVDPFKNIAMNTATASPAATAEQLDGLSFDEVASQVGLTQPHAVGSVAEGPAASSGGAAVGDFDNDGDPDLFLTRVGAPNLLYRNDGGRFADVSAGSGLDGAATDSGSTGATWVDLDGDGNQDLVVLGLGETPNRVFLGDGNGRFTDETTKWNLPSPTSPDPDSAMFSVTAGDYDHDGRIDLLLSGSDPHLAEVALAKARVGPDDVCGKKAGRALASIDTSQSMTRLLRNTGTTFVDETSKLDLGESLVVAMAVRFVDLNGDGWDDLVIAGRLCSSKLLLNDTKGGFFDATDGSGLDRVATANGAAVLDANQDGNADLFLTGIAYPVDPGECPLINPMWGCAGNTLLLGNGDGKFDNSTKAYGLAHAGWAWGAEAWDFNNDAISDLLVTTGFSDVSTDNPNTTDAALLERSSRTPPRLWLGSGSSKPTELPEAAQASGLTSTKDSKAVIAADFDRDGLMDILIVATGGPPSLYRNTTQNSHRWLSVRLHDAQSANHQGIGAKVTIELSGNKSSSAQVSSTGSFQSGAPAELHFGLGDHDSVSKLTVSWPDGELQTLENVQADQHLTIER